MEFEGYYIKQYGTDLSFNMYLYDTNGDALRRVLLGKDLQHLLLNGAKYITQNSALVDTPTIEMVELEIAEIRSHLRLLEKSINEGHR